MNLKTYLDALNNLVKKHPESLKMVVKYSSDDEGNEFLPTRFTASVMYDEETNKQFVCLN